MKILIPLLVALALTLIIACKKDEVKQAAPSPTENEGQFVRMLVSDQNLANYYLVNPEKGTVETQQGQFVGANLYRTPSGQFVAIINFDDNLVTFFDSGIEGHDDHAHSKYPPKWALAKSTAKKPVHFYGKDNNLLAFNDGEGTLSHFKESHLHTETSARVFCVGAAHHGAVALFSNGTIAVTEKDGTAEGSLPERAKIVDMEGKTLYASTVQTRGIHGEAGNGELVLYGSKDGILKVSQDGTQSLITYPASFGTTWLGTIYYGIKCKTFLGFKATIGLYKIDPVANLISVIEENKDLFSATFDWEGEHLLVLYKDGTMKVLNANTGSVLANKNVVSFPPNGSKGVPNPMVAGSRHFVYITDGLNGKIKMYKKENLDLVREISLPGKPAKMALMGSLAHTEDDH